MAHVASHPASRSEVGKRQVVAGAVGGLMGGMVMAIFAMLLAISRDGVWSPVRGITSVVFGDSHYGGSFDAPSVVVGAAGHMMNSVVLGIVFAVVATLVFRRARPMAVWMLGAMYGLVVWVVMMLGVAHGLQASNLLVDALPAWGWAVAHVMFGVVTAMVFTTINRSTE